MNKQGSRVLEVMENYSMWVCNGRSFKDRTASYTYVSVNGSSVIDHVWVNQFVLESYLEFEVFCTQSGAFDHLPVILKENVSSFDPPQYRVNKVNYSVVNRNPSCMQQFSELLINSRTIH